MTVLLDHTLHGRAEAVARLRALLAAACAGSGGLALLRGEPGVGKSRLAEQVASDALGCGAIVAWGRAWETGGAPAYWPWTQIFRSLGLPADPFARAASDAEGGLAFEDAVRIGRRALDGTRAAQLSARLSGELRLVVAEALVRLERTLEGRTLAAETAALAEASVAPR